MASSSYWAGRLNEAKALKAKAEERLKKLEELKGKIDPIPEALESVIDTFQKIGFSLSAVCPAGYPIDNGSYNKNADDLQTAESDYLSLISECANQIEAERLDIRDFDNSITYYQNQYDIAVEAERQAYLASLQNANNSKKNNTSTKK